MFVLVFTAVLLMTLGAIGEVIDRCAHDPLPVVRLRLVPATVDGTDRQQPAARTAVPGGDASTPWRTEAALRRCG